MLLRPWLSVAHSCHLVRGEAGSVFVLGAEGIFSRIPSNMLPPRSTRFTLMSAVRRVSFPQIVVPNTNNAGARTLKSSSDSRRERVLSYAMPDSMTKREVGCFWAVDRIMWRLALVSAT